MGIDTVALTPWISITLLIPVAGALLLALVPGDRPRAHRGISLFFSVLAFLAGITLWVNFDPALAGFQMVEDHPWIPAIGARYTVGLDGISLLIFQLTTLLTPLTVLSTFRAIRDRTREFHIALLLLETTMLGTLVAMDLLLFFAFWEMMLVPMFLIIGVWGGERRIYAALKFFLYTAAGSVLMLVAILYLYREAGGNSFSLMDWQRLDLPLREQAWLFLAFALAFAIKVPLFPFHTWLPDAHVEAPTAGSVILAGVLLKMGTYGFLRFAIPLFPEAAGLLSLPVWILAVAGVVHGSLTAWAQDDVKKLVAYSSVAHLGFVMLGMFALNVEAVQGSVLQMVNHGVSTGALFLLVGVLYERRHTRRIDAYGGIAGPMKVFAAVLVIVTLSSIGLPGTNGFVGEFLILAGTFREALSSQGGFRTAGLILAVVATTGVVLGAIYMLSMVRRVLFGPIVHEENRTLPDVNGREFAVLAVLVVLVFWIGWNPRFFLSRSQASVTALVDRYHQRVAAQRWTGDGRSEAARGPFRAPLAEEGAR
ncbi:NADH-quinone oxidoreductase subunit M [Myxococcota bacterium]|nr:NADH-quinone oxidoreductase subunit M [Myxococcota bacterium]